MKNTLEEGRRYLSEFGLNMFGVLDCNCLPDTVRGAMSDSIELSSYSRLVIVGNAGQRFWHALQKAGMPDEHPMDTFSRRVTQEFLDNYLGDAENELVFPTHHMIPLQRIGALLGWAQVSPLGVGISEQYGLWFAYRSAFLTTAELPLSKKIEQEFSCDQCAETPCVRACPASAVSLASPYDVKSCFGFRLKTNSPCGDRCLARIACPVAPESRYPREMIHYIYETSMETVRRYSVDRDS